MLKKYIKPLSMTWWSGIIPLISGVFIATVDIHLKIDMVSAINNLTGNIPASGMITYGLTVIGLRGKDG